MSTHLKVAVVGDQFVGTELFVDALHRHLAPFADGAQHEHGDHAHAPGRDERAGKRADAARCGAGPVALQLHHRVPDQPPGQPADEDRHERSSTGGGGGQGGKGPVLIGHSASVTV